MTVLTPEITFEQLDEVLTTLEEVAEDKGISLMMTVIEEVAGPMMSNNTPAATLEALIQETDELANNYDLSMNQRGFFEEAHDEFCALR